MQYATRNTQYAIYNMQYAICNKQYAIRNISRLNLNHSYALQLLPPGRCTVLYCTVPTRHYQLLDNTATELTSELQYLGLHI